MANFHQTIAAHTKDLSDDAHRSAGAPTAGSMDQKHKDFLKLIIGLIESGDIDPYDQNTFIKEGVYDSLSEEWREKVDLSLINMANQLRLLYEFYKSKETPEESPQLQVMVEHLWAMVQRIEDHHDVFKF
jgi:hypothetical protein